MKVAKDVQMRKVLTFSIRQRPCFCYPGFGSISCHATSQVVEGSLSRKGLMIIHPVLRTGVAMRKSKIDTLRPWNPHCGTKLMPIRSLGTGMPNVTFWPWSTNGGRRGYTKKTTKDLRRCPMTAEKRGGKSGVSGQWRAQGSDAHRK